MFHNQQNLKTIKLWQRNGISITKSEDEFRIKAQDALLMLS